MANRALAKAVAELQHRDWSYELFRDDSWEAVRIYQELYDSAV